MIKFARNTVKDPNKYSTYLTLTTFKTRKRGKTSVRATSKPLKKTQIAKKAKNNMNYSCTFSPNRNNKGKIKREILSLSSTRSPFKTVMKNCTCISWAHK